MIGFLQGRIIETNEEGVIVDVNGVGYELTCSSNTLDYVLAGAGPSGATSIDQDTRFFVHTSVREDAITLFGFATTLEKRMFLTLLKVNGVGPKMAIKVLSGASIDQLSHMIESGDVKGLSNLPKVGKKTAEQMILTLKGKLVLSSEETPTAKAPKKPLPPVSRFTGTRSDILSALVNLGFRLQDAERVVGDLPEEIEIQAGVRQGLQALSGGF